MASLGQNVGENPRHVSWKNENPEFEEGRQNKMASRVCRLFTSTLVTFIAEKCYCCTRNSGVSHKKFSKPANKYHKEIT